MLLFSISFQDVFNYLIFTHAETVLIGERRGGENGELALHCLVKSSRSRRPPAAETCSKLTQDSAQRGQEGRANSTPQLSAMINISQSRERSAEELAQIQWGPVWMLFRGDLYLTLSLSDMCGEFSLDGPNNATRKE